MDLLQFVTLSSSQIYLYSSYAIRNHVSCDDRAALIFGAFADTKPAITFSSHKRDDQFVATKAIVIPF